MTATVLVLTEDGSAGAVATIAQLVELLRAHVGAVTPVEYRDWRQVNPGVPATGSRMFQRRLRVDLVRTLAREALAQRFVVLHVDADVPWSRREESVNARHAEGIVAHVAELSGHTVARNCVLLVPTAAIEAWVFQATAALRVHAAAARWGTEVVARLEAWERDRTALDELLRPKDHLPADRPPNRELAAQVPVASVVAAQRSLATAADGLRDAPTPLGLA